MSDYHTRTNTLYSYSLSDYRRNDGKQRLETASCDAVVYSSISIALHREIVIYKTTGFLMVQSCVIMKMHYGTIQDFRVG